MKRLSVIAILLVLLTACNRNKMEPEILESPNLCLSIKGKTVFSYEENDCQISFNRDKRIFRIGDDTMDDFFTLTTGVIPSSVGEKVKGDLQWTSSNSIQSRKYVQFEVQKMENGTVWLWSKTDRIAAVVKILE
ncbi:MAG: hypothetical protein IKP46_01950 [Bacteroidales bacterium]|nr:hypothetical protein [Bacteroidales bacterium]